MNWLKNRLKEGSTITGLCAMIPQAIGIFLTGATPAAIGTLIIGVIAVVVPESVRK